MSSTPTRASLLLELRDRDNSLAWREFVSLYMPLLYRYALKAGLQDSDASDVAQDTMRQVVRNIDHFEYDSKRGSFRGWLLTIARNIIRNHWNHSPTKVRGTGDTAMISLLHEQPSKEEKDHWEVEYQKRLFEVAAEKIRGSFRESTWQAFWLSSVDGLDSAEVASRLGMTPGAVYIARSRVIAKMRVEVARLSSESDSIQRE